MNLQSILEPIEAFITWTFVNILENLGNLPNVLFILVGFVGLGYWLKLQGKFNKKAQHDGGLK
ncbi:MAG TPA: hypothetical protein VFV37_01250 [Luteibaculaceae bacterium]|jgi:hypothetical protein|nr:hypothetical protein [Luteibaculaceae bacterium]